MGLNFKNDKSLSFPIIQEKNIIKEVIIIKQFNKLKFVVSFSLEAILVIYTNKTINPPK